MTDRGTLRALLDADGRLVRADDALLSLNARAGGAVGEPLAVVRLATLARLARRLGVLIARGVTVADADADIDLWVRAEPVPDGIALAIPDWRERRPWIAPAPVPEQQVSPGEEGEDRWETDAAMRLTRVAPEAAQRFGFVAEASLGKPLTQLFRLAEDEGGDFPILTALGLRQGFVGQRATVRGSGQAVTLEARARLDPTGAFAGFDGVLRARRDAEAAPALTEAFTRRLEGVLRAPLGRIIANADSIHAQADGPLRQDYVEYAADIASAGRHLVGLVDDLADLQAIERPGFVVAAERVDLADVARRAAGLLGVRAADAGVAIERPAPEQILLVTAEFRRALQVLVNLVGNAVRYSAKGGTVWVRCLAKDGSGTVTVTDHGKGIAPEDQARIFSKFERVDRSEPGGSGLGLYIARRLARAMGGDLTVESASGQGACFTLTLPLTR